MPNEIYHRSEWGNPAEQWGNVYLNADLTNELYKRASEYENSWVTDQLLNGVGTKPSIILTPTAYEDGVLNSVKPSDGNADFDFTRGSSATRVNEKGLVQDVQLLSGELVQNGNFEQIGSEIVTNGNFETDSDWVLSSGSSIANGQLTIDALDGSFQSAQKLLSTTVGKIYKLQFEIKSINSGGIIQFIYNASVIGLSNYTSVGTHTFYFTSTNSSSFLQIKRYFPSQTYVTIDNVSVKEVGQNWTFGTGWSIEDGKVYFDNPTGTELYQSLSTTASKYRISFDLDITSGTIQTSFSSPSTSTIESFTTSGTKTVDITTTASFSRFRFVGLGGSVFNIDNISVVEITYDTDLPRINYTNFDYEDVLGNELVNYDNFTYGSGGWSLVGSKWVFDDVTSGYLVIDNFDVEVGQKYQVTVNISISSENANFKITSGNGQTQLFNYTDFADGETTFETTVTGVDGTIERLFAATSLTDNPFTLNSISIKRLTEDVVIPYSGEGSLLLEPQSTNLITYSEDFSGWSLDDVTVESDSDTSPDGNNKATLIKGNTNLSRHHIRQTLSGTVDGSYSIFAKARGLRYLQIASINTTNQYVNFDLEDGLVGAVGSDFSNAKIEEISSGWYRLSVTSDDRYNSFYISLVSGTNATWLESWAMPNNTDGLYIWGAQIEALSYATSYIPTNGSTVTRLADVCNNSGSSDLINSTEGVLYAEISALADDVTNRHITLSDGTDTNRLVLKYDNQSNVIQAFNRVSGVETAFLTASVTDITLFSKCALKFKLNDYALWIDGVEVDTDTSSTTFPSSTLNDLKFSATNSDFYGNVKCVAVFKEALSDTELQKLTS